MAQILVIDDQEIVRTLVIQMVEALGHTGIGAPDCEMGVTMCRTDPPALAFVDVFMPGKDGVECIQELRQVAPDTVLVAITGGGAYGNVDILKVAERLGAARTLQKPFALGQLRDLLTELLPENGAS